MRRCGRLRRHNGRPEIYGRLRGIVAGAIGRDRTPPGADVLDGLRTTAVFRQRDLAKPIRARGRSGVTRHRERHQREDEADCDRTNLGSHGRSTLFVNAARFLL